MFPNRFFFFAPGKILSAPANTQWGAQAMKRLVWDRRELSAGLDVYDVFSGRVRKVLAAAPTGRSRRVEVEPRIVVLAREWHVTLA